MALPKREENCKACGKPQCENPICLMIGEKQTLADKPTDSLKPNPKRDEED